MWKLLIGFVLFAVLAVFVLMKSGADVDMSGEKHGVETSSESSTHEPAAAPQAASVGASK